MRRYKRVRMTVTDLAGLGFESIAIGPFPPAERALLEALFDKYHAARLLVPADDDPANVLPNDMLWGDGPGQATDLRSWLKLKFPSRNWGQIQAELRVLKPERHLAATPEEMRSALAAMDMEEGGGGGRGGRGGRWCAAPRVRR
jgi:hypothetical protein